MKLARWARYLHPLPYGAIGYWLGRRPLKAEESGSNPTGATNRARVPRGRGRTSRALQVCVQIAPRAIYAGVDQSAGVTALRTRAVWVRIPPPVPFMEGAAEWSATGPENQGSPRAKGSIPSPSANRESQSARSPSAPAKRCAGSKAGEFRLLGSPPFRPCRSMAGHDFGKVATEVRFLAWAPVHGLGKPVVLARGP